MLKFVKNDIFNLHVFVMVANVPKTKATFIASRNATNKVLENRSDLQLSGETINISTNTPGCSH